MGTRRKWLLGVALLASIAAALLVEDPEGELVAQRRPRAARGVDQATSDTLPMARDQPVAPGTLSFARGQYAMPSSDPFAPRSWRPAPPPPGKPPPPSAPPLPFQFMGKLEEGGQTLVFLSQHERTLTVRQGQTLEGLYRVDRITPESIVFVYLPLKQKQSLPLGRFN